MTLTEARKRVKNIEAEQWDDEKAHVDEDDLYADFVSHVADNEGSVFAEIAREILKTKDISFERWCG